MSISSDFLLLWCNSMILAGVMANKDVRAKSNLCIVVLVLEMCGDETDRFNRLLAFRRQLERSAGLSHRLTNVVGRWFAANATRCCGGGGGRCLQCPTLYAGWWRFVGTGSREADTRPHDVSTGAASQLLIVRLLRPTVVVTAAGKRNWTLNLIKPVLYYIKLHILELKYTPS